MSITVGQTAFVAGEWSPYSLSRLDNPKYGAACKTMRNFYPHPQGPASNRQGLYYVATSKDSTKKWRFVPFTFSVVQGYGLIFGDQYIRFVKDGGTIVSPVAITGAADNGSGLIRITSAAHGFATGNTVTITGVTGTTEANGTWVITVITANTYDLVASAFVHAYVSGGTGTAIVEVVTPYVEADLDLLKFEQSADTLYIRHPSYDRRKLTRSSHTAWTLSVEVAGSTLPAPGAITPSAGAGHTYVVTQALTDGTESVASPSCTSAPTNSLSWTAISPAPDLYKIYEVINGLTEYVGQTTTNSYTIPSTTPDATRSAPTAKNPFNGAGNWPGSCAFFEQRLYEGRTNNKPQTFNGSVIGGFENSNISYPLQENDAIELTLNSSEVNEIKWMLGFNTMVIGTSGAEWLLSPGANGNSITYKNFTLLRQSRWGSCDIKPIIVGHDLIFIEASKKKVRDLYYSITVGGVNGGYDANDLTVLSQHLFFTYGIKDWAYQQQPDSMVWCIRDDGIGLGLTYLKEHQIYAWSRHDTQGKFETLCVVGNTNGSKDVYFGTQRKINGVQTRFIELLANRSLDTNQDIEDAFFVDCGLTYDGSVAATLTPGVGANVQGTAGVVFTAGSSVFVIGDIGRQIRYRYKTYDVAPANTDPDPQTDPNAIPTWHTGIATITGYTSGTVVTASILNAWPDLSAIASGGWSMTVTTISGLSHLNGMHVVVLANGSVIKSLLVSGGSITLPYAVSKAQIGLSYTCDLETVNLDYPTKEGSVQDKIRHVNTAFLKLINTRSMWIGPDADHLLEQSFGRNALNEPLNLFNGDTEPFNIKPGNDNRAGSVFIRVTDPLPITVKAVYARINHGQT